MSLVAHFPDDPIEPLTHKYKSWMLSNFSEINPIIKLSHPILSCKVANSQTNDNRSPVPSMQVALPCPWTYFEMTVARSGCVSFIRIHQESPATASKNASVRPALRQRAMWVHVSLHAWQLVQVGSCPSWCARNFIVPAIPSMCFAAHIGIAWAPSAESCGPIPSQPTCPMIVFSSNERESWQAGNGHEILWGGLFLTIVSWS